MTSQELELILQQHKLWTSDNRIGKRADLYGANLYGADLRGADLRGANLYGANLGGADLRGANLGNFSIVPETGSFTAYKKLKDGIIATLLIPAEAKRVSSLVGRKCRAEYAQVISLSKGTDGRDTYTGNTIYVVGEIVRPDRYDEDIRIECTNGIHFFITKKEAEEYT